MHTCICTFTCSCNDERNSGRHLVGRGTDLGSRECRRAADARAALKAAARSFHRHRQRSAQGCTAEKAATRFAASAPGTPGGLSRSPFRAPRSRSRLHRRCHPLLVSFSVARGRVLARPTTQDRAHRSILHSLQCYNRYSMLKSSRMKFRIARID